MTDGFFIALEVRGDTSPRTWLWVPDDCVLPAVASARLANLADASKITVSARFGEETDARRSTAFVHTEGPRALLDLTRVVARARDAAEMVRGLR